MTDEMPEGRTKYDWIAKICFDKLYLELDDDQQIEVRDLWNEKN